METAEQITFKKNAQEVGRDELCITVKNEKESVLLNPSVSIVWDYMDGYQSVEAICQNMLESHGKDNKPDFLREILMESIEILLSHNLITEIFVREVY